MTIKLFFFGVTSDVAGIREFAYDTAAPDVASALKEILAAHPQLAEHKLLFALNQEYADGSEAIREGDEIAIFTAVSGG